jgi:hypothetical protein
MKAGESTIAQAGGEAASSPGLCFSFILGPRKLKTNFKKIGFRLGPDLAIQSDGDCFL